MSTVPPYEGPAQDTVTPAALPVTATPGSIDDASHPDGSRPGRGSGGLARLLTIAMSMVGTQIVTSVLGAAFWSLAARAYAVDAVGVGSAAIAAMTVLGSVGMLGLGTLLMAKLPTIQRESDRLGLMRASMTVVGCASGILAVAWTAVTPLLSDTLRPISSNVFAATLFCVGVVLFAVTTMLDFALLSAAGGAVQFVRNVVTSVVKLGLIPVFVVVGWTSGLDLYLAWTLGLGLSLPVCYRHFRRPPHDGLPRDGTAPQALRFAGFRQLRAMRGEAGGHHMLNLALQIPTLILPILAAVAATAADTAYFTTARLAASFFFIIPFALAIAVFAHSGQDEEKALANIRLTLPLGLAAAAGIFLVTAPFASLVMTIFGGAYTSGVAVSAFRIMMLAGVPLVVKDHYVSVRRVQGRLGSAVRVVGVGTAMEIVLALAGGRLGGVNGLCWGWLLAVVLEGLITLPPLLMVLRHSRPNRSATVDASEPVSAARQERLAATFYPLEVLLPVDYTNDYTNDGVGIDIGVTPWDHPSGGTNPPGPAGDADEDRMRTRALGRPDAGWGGTNVRLWQRPRRP